jgi:hypothetical protein
MATIADQGTPGYRSWVSLLTLLAASPMISKS